MSDINSELERLRAAAPLDRTAVFESILRNFSSGAVADALCASPPKAAPAKKRVKPGVDRGGKPFSDR